MSNIAWTDQTWNPVTGCDRISPGCDHCYALDMAARLKRMGQPRYEHDGDPRTSGPGFGLTLHEDKLSEPLHWRKPRMVFVNSMSDLFHKSVPDEFIFRVFHVMGECPQHTFQILTKRPKRMARTVAAYYESGVARITPLPNVWLGVSIESREYVWRADRLRETPAAVRFISAEPLIGPLTIGPSAGSGTHEWSDGYVGPMLQLSGIDWLIVGGESGANYRPMEVEWALNLRAASRTLSTAFFMKQDCGPRAGMHGRFGDETQWPREFPEERAS